MGRRATARVRKAEQEGLFDHCEDFGPARPECFSVERGKIHRTITTRNGKTRSSFVVLPDEMPLSGDLPSDFDLCWLRTKQKPNVSDAKGTIVVADLFAGCGGMSAGVQEACRALALKMQPALAIEMDPEKLRVYALNFPETISLAQPIETLIDGELGESLTASEKLLRRKIGKLDILLGGPPCQGHSDLNNFTRRSDPRNGLILRFARAVEIFRPAHLIIENVQGIRHDKNRSLSSVEKHLRTLGYWLDQTLVECSIVGVPQRRRRFFMIGSRERSIDISKAIQQYATSERSVRWACEDLLDIHSETLFDSAAVHSDLNQRRIEYLFTHDLFDLPDEVRPDCHRLKNHAYRSVYGRMQWDEPAPTLTTGFGSTGQGRFVHPLKPRTLTPHEAARLQLIPDFFSFGMAGRTQLQKMIGNAVPPKVSYLLALELLR